MYFYATVEKRLFVFPKRIIRDYIEPKFDRILDKNCPYRKPVINVKKNNLIRKLESP